MAKTKREWYITQMEQLGIDILCLQETHVTTNHAEEKDGYTFIFSTGVSDKDRDTKNKNIQEHKQTLKLYKQAKGKQKGKPARWPSPVSP